MKTDTPLDMLSEYNEFMKYNGVRVICVEKDMAVTELTISSHSLNPYGIIHGGALFTLMDVAAGVAARTDQRRYVTLNCDVHFCKSTKSGVLRATGKVVHRGRTTCIVETEVKTSCDVLLSRGSFTMFCLGEEATAQPPAPGISHS